MVLFDGDKKGDSCNSKSPSFGILPIATSDILVPLFYYDLKWDRDKEKFFYRKIFSDETIFKGFWPNGLWPKSCL